VVLRYRKFNPRHARWALKEKYQKLPIIDVARDSVQLPTLKTAHSINTYLVPARKPEKQSAKLLIRLHFNHVIF